MTSPYKAVRLVTKYKGLDKGLNGDQKSRIKI